MNKEEKRMIERIHYTHSLCFTVLDGMSWPNKALIHGQAIDVSQSGLRITTQKNLLKRGALIQLKVPIEDIDMQVPVLAEVRWTREDLSGRCQIGVRFVVQ
jgi:hypothetical protein